MSDFHILFTLFASSARLQKKRAYLTIAAIAWGTVAILMLLAFGQGLRMQLEKNRRSTGENLAIIEEARQDRIAVAEMVDPDRAVDQDHAASDRRRGATAASGSEPPRRTRRAALSRSISAFSASRTSDDFSVRPVNACARAISSSSRARVVRIACLPGLGTQYSIE